MQLSPKFRIPFRSSKSSFLAFIIFAFSLTSCTFLIKKMYRVKKPKLENVESLSNYLNKNKFDTTKLILLKDIVAFKQYLKINSDVPNAMFFNNMGEFVDYRKSPEDCNGKVSEFISSIEEINKVRNEKSLKLNEINQLLSKSIAEQGEITIIITWVVYIGKLNKKKSFEWIKLIKEAQQKGVKINYYLLNCDILESWEGDFDDLKKTKMR
jgi:hypothetical protein